MKNTHRKAKNWTSLFTAQFLGVFNDHLLKFLVIFICGNLFPEKRALLTSVATALLVLPYIFLSPYAGKLAIIKYKSSILVFLKLMEIPIMLIATVGFYIKNIPLMLFAVLLMGLQSCIYSPSKYGLIRDVDGEKGISFGTGIMEMLTFVGVLLGTFLASRLDASNYTSWIILLSIAILGWFAAKQLNVKESEPQPNFKGQINPFKFISSNYKFAKTLNGINLTVLGLSAFWVIASLVQMVVVDYVPTVLNGDDTITGNIMTCAALGIGFGCAFAGIIGGQRVNYSLITYGGVLMSTSLTLLYLLEPDILTTEILIFFIAFFCGVYKVPLNSYIQETVKGRKLGDIIAYNNLITFLFIVLASGINAVISMLFSSKEVFLITAIIGWTITISITIKLKVIIPSIVSQFFYITSLILFKIRVYGRRNIPKKGGMLLISNHISILDSFLIVRPLRRPLIFVIDKVFFKNPFLGWFFKKLHMIPVSALWRHKAINKFYEQCHYEINDGRILCIFPEGQITRVGNLGEFKKGFENIAKDIKAPILPVYIDNAIGTPLSHVAGTSGLKKFKLNNLRLKLKIKVGPTLPADSTTFTVRQKVQELGAEVFNMRIDKKENLQKLLKNNLETIFDKKVSTKILNLAKYICTTSQVHIGIDCNNKLNSVVANYATILSGRVSVNISDINCSEKSKIRDTYKIKNVISDDNIDKLLGSKTKTVCRKIKSKKDVVTICCNKSGKTVKITHEAAISNAKALHQQYNFKNDVNYVSEPVNDDLSWFFAVGLPITYNIKTNINELNDSTFTLSYSLPDNNPFKYILSDIMLDSKNCYRLHSCKEFFGIISANAPDYNGLDAAKHKIYQRANKLESSGRAMPNIAVKIVDYSGEDIKNENCCGIISVRCSYDTNKWLQTSERGFICKEGFLHIE